MTKQPIITYQIQRGPDGHSWEDQTPVFHYLLLAKKVLEAERIKAQRKDTREQFRLIERRWRVVG